LKKKKATPAFLGGSGRVDGKTDSWSCPVCTLENLNTVPLCTACQTPRPVEPTSSRPTPRPPAIPPSSPVSPPPASLSTDSEWVCSACTYHNPAGSEHCVMCSEPSPATLAQARSEPVSPERPPLPQSGPEALLGPEPGFMTRMFGNRQFPPSATPTTHITPESPAPVAAPVSRTSQSGPWSCASCTFKNPSPAPFCGTCHRSNPNWIAPPQTAPVSGIGSMPGGSISSALFGSADPQWECQRCGNANEVNLIHCRSCQLPNPHIFFSQQQQNPGCTIS